jgi:putative N6-adenine-specific DNA methylase
MSSRPRYDAFVITAPGLEPIVAGELKALGARDARVTEGGATFTATRRSLYEANLHLRTASRVIVRAGEFVARAFHELERRAGKVPWEAFVSPNLGVSLRVTCRKSRLYHSDAVRERVAGAIASRVSGVRFTDDLDDDFKENRRGQSRLNSRSPTHSSVPNSNDSDPFDFPGSHRRDHR